MSYIFKLLQNWTPALCICLALSILLFCQIGGCDPSHNNFLHPKKEKDKDDPFAPLRKKMVDTQIRARGVKDSLVLEAMQRVKRHTFVPEHLRDLAYNDYPLSIGHDQTISQPYIVALMTELLELKGGERVLEIGTGSGYQAAILGEIAGEVYTIEIIEDLAQKAEKRLKDIGYTNIHVKAGDGYKGWPQEAPFDAIIVTAAPDHVPDALIEQLKEGGILVLPVGSYHQYLYRIRKTAKGITQEEIAPVRFVPMVEEEK